MSAVTDITNAIVSELEQGTVLWNRPWAVRLPANYISQKNYRGINVVLLWRTALAKGYVSNSWLTYRQATQRAEHVKKGQKATSVVYSSSFKAKAKDEGDDEEKEIRYLKYYWVFNLEQTTLPPEEAKPAETVEDAERFIASQGVPIKYGGNSACYIPSQDIICLPSPADFTDTTAFYTTSLHEHVHSTGHPSRLNRAFSRFGDEAYAFEKLIAELGSAFTAAHLGLPSKIREDHAPYIASWIRVLKQDKRAIFKVASEATKALDYMLVKASQKIYDDWMADKPQETTCPTKLTLRS